MLIFVTDRGAIEMECDGQEDEGQSGLCARQDVSVSGALSRFFGHPAMYRTGIGPGPSSGSLQEVDWLAETGMKEAKQGVSR